MFIFFIFEINCSDTCIYFLYCFLFASYYYTEYCCYNRLSFFFVFFVWRFKIFIFILLLSFVIVSLRSEKFSLYWNYFIFWIGRDRILLFFSVISTFPLFLGLYVVSKTFSLVVLFFVADDIVLLTLLWSSKLDIYSPEYESVPSHFDFYLQGHILNLIFRFFYIFTNVLSIILLTLVVSESNWSFLLNLEVRFYLYTIYCYFERIMWSSYCLFFNWM